MERILHSGVGHVHNKSLSSARAAKRLFEFYLRLNITMTNERKRALTAADVATIDDADEKMLGHWLMPAL